MSTTTDIGNAALHSLIGRVRAEHEPDIYDLGYYRGQIDIIKNYLAPSDELLTLALREVDELRKRIVS